jgi:hypothetical protein
MSRITTTPRTTAVHASCSALPPPHATLASRQSAMTLPDQAVCPGSIVICVSERRFVGLARYSLRPKLCFCNFVFCGATSIASLPHSRFLSRSLGHLETTCCELFRLPSELGGAPYFEAGRKQAHGDWTEAVTRGCRSLPLTVSKMTLIPSAFSASGSNSLRRS